MTTDLEQAKRAWVQAREGVLTEARRTGGCTLDTVVTALVAAHLYLRALGCDSGEAAEELTVAVVRALAHRDAAN